MKIGRVGQMSINQTGGINIVGDDINLAPQQLGAASHAILKRDEKIFIVHGHDETAIGELKEYLQERLGFPEPAVLSSVAGKSRTVIEAFEEEAEHASLVFVLVTPDDVQEDGQLRARQNVIFELGYFWGRLGRRSGRTIVLLRGDVELPSDIRGMLYIRFDQGILAAGEEIRRAVDAALGDD